MNRKAPKRRLIAAMGRVRAVVRRLGAVPVAVLRRLGSAAAQGYRIDVEFDQAVALGTQADVQIAGVTIGKVVSVGLDRDTGRTKAVLQISPRFAPRPADTRAILRQKTLLGETYVQLSFGNPNGPMLPDGGRLPQAQVAPTVQLDQILSTFDPATRRAFEIWMQQDGIAFTGRGEDFNAAIAALYPFATNVQSVLAVLRRDSAATRTLLADGAQVLARRERVARATAGPDRSREHRLRGHGRTGRIAAGSGARVPGVPDRHAGDGCAREHVCHRRDAARR